MKKLSIMALAITLVACGKDDGQKTGDTKTENASAKAWDDVSGWKKLDLNTQKIPLSISVPAGATAKVGEINTETVEVDLKSDPMCVYTVQKETLGGDPISNVAEAVKLHKETYNGFTDFKVLKEDANGYTYSYKDMAGKPCHGFFFAKEAGGAVYGITTLNDFSGTEKQIDAMYNGLK